MDERRQFLRSEGFFSKSDGSCAGCREFKPKVSGTSRCRECFNEQQWEHYHKIKTQYPEEHEKRRVRDRARAVKLYAENPEKYKAQVKAWKDRNPKAFAELKAKRRAEEMQRVPKWLTREDKKIISFIYEMAKMLTDTTGEDYQVDHIIPLRGKLVCGLHVPGNLQILTRLENIRKGNKW
jgi:hypothetical protein